MVCVRAGCPISTELSSDVHRRRAVRTRPTRGVPGQRGSARHTRAAAAVSQDRLRAMARAGAPPERCPTSGRGAVARLARLSATPRTMTRVRCLACRISVRTPVKPAASGSLASWPGWPRVRPCVAWPRAGFDQTLGEQDPACGGEHPAGFGQASGAVAPVMDGAEHPGDGRACGGQREGFGASVDKADIWHWPRRSMAGAGSTPVTIMVTVSRPRRAGRARDPVRRAAMRRRPQTPVAVFDALLAPFPHGNRDPVPESSQKAGGLSRSSSEQASDLRRDRRD